MAWHILAATHFDFEAIEHDADADRSPRHFLRYLSRQWNATIDQPDPSTSVSKSPIDRMAAWFYAEPNLWAMARRVRKRLEPGDGVYAAGSTAGMSLAFLCSLLGPRSVRFAIAVVDVQRPRTRIMGWLLVLLRTKLVLIVPHSAMVDVAAKGFGRFADGIIAINGLTDFGFFRPPDFRSPDSNPASSESPPGRAVVASCGTEARDYRLLAEATEGLDVDVQVCFASPNLTGKTRYTVPDPMPDHMDIRYYSFVDLRTLYQEAAVVAVPTIPNRYAAGLTTVFEAVACGRPVVVARAPGVVQELIDRDLVGWYEMGDGDGLRRAIQDVLADPTAAEERAKRAFQWVRSHYSAGAYQRRIEQAVEQAFGAADFAESAPAITT